MGEKITLYTTGCPMCKSLFMQLTKAGYKEPDNLIIIDLKDPKNEEELNKLMEQGVKTMPVLKVKNGELLKFKDAIMWLKEN